MIIVICMNARGHFVPPLFSPEECSANERLFARLKHLIQPTNHGFSDSIVIDIIVIAREKHVVIVSSHKLQPRQDFYGAVKNKL